MANDTAVTTSMANLRAHCSQDVSSTRFWRLTSEQRDETFARLREREPVSWQRPVEDAVSPDPDDPGYWAVVRHTDIVTVSRDHRTFVSGHGVQFDLLPTEVLEMSQSFLAMDPPRHDRLRRLVSAAFTPKRISVLDDHVRTAAREVVDGFARETGEIDFVERCAAQLPVRVFADMFGVPYSLRGSVREGAAAIMAWADPESLAGRSPAELQMTGCTTLHGIASELVAWRRKTPTDDLFSGLVHARIDGQQLTDAEIGAFFVLMAVAGTDTTTHTASLTVKALGDAPDQRDWLLTDYDARIHTAVEEFIRFASPVMTFRRTATRETTLGGQTIQPGEKVVMFYSSGNRDTAAFHEPARLDLSRNPNPHVGFGGGGIHYCLGNQLARTTLRELFRQLLTRLPDLSAGEPDLLGTNFMRGVKRLPVTFTPER
ncbi:cytochrome P450 [Pseudonocardia spinosispora]|uniref:cytochrome P450 n=1 Tax=Pseudonocardia spinosispora TaxID=103441 RepID=UPI0005684D41|nr:cytochrome P450 [Pseudonocardia spinosispora]